MIHDCGFVSLGCDARDWTEVRPLNFARHVSHSIVILIPDPEFGTSEGRVHSTSDLPHHRIRQRLLKLHSALLLLWRGFAHKAT